MSHGYDDLDRDPSEYHFDLDDLHDEIHPDEVDEGVPLDDRGIPVRPDRGMTAPKEGRCNALLHRWRERYGEPRFCGQYPLQHYDTCWTHRDRHQMKNITAEEALQHGLNATSRDHLYRKLDAWKQVYAWGVHESLMGDSRYEFGVEHRPREFDFSDDPIDPTLPDQEGPVYEIAVAHATENLDRELALWAAAVDSVKMLDAQKIITEDRMRVESTTQAEFDTATVVGEEGAGTPKSWHTIEEYNEHYLNLPYSRLVRDRADLLEYGGVEVGDAADEDNVDVAELDSLTVVEPDPDVDSPMRDRAKEAGVEVGYDPD